MKQGKLHVTILLLFAGFLGYSQEPENDSEPDQKNVTINGYVKDLFTLTIQENADSTLQDNLVHNRFNLQWYATKKLKGKLEIRNRIFSGDLVKAIPNYADLIDVNDDFFDLSTTIESNTHIFHSMIDRAYLQWSEEKWQLSVGRQRINWGVNVAWNPNDIFNAYSLLNFDYEERPGSDAIRYQRYIGFAGGYEFSVKMADSWDEVTAAGMYKWNVKSYDFQTLGGVMQNHLVLGGAWAGNLGLTGFKGEFTYFNKLNDTRNSDFLASITSDYIFPNSLYLNGSILYNSSISGATPLGFGSSPANLDVRSISSTRWSAYFQSAYTFHPLLNGSMLVLFFPGDSGLILGPSITYSPLTNMDFDLISQMLFDKRLPDFYFVYARLRYSF